MLVVVVTTLGGGTTLGGAWVGGIQPFKYNLARAARPAQHDYARFVCRMDSTWILHMSERQTTRGATNRTNCAVALLKQVHTLDEIQAASTGCKYRLQVKAASTGCAYSCWTKYRSEVIYDPRILL